MQRMLELMKVQSAPDDNAWHCLYIVKNNKSKGRLYRDGKSVFDDDYYMNNRDLQMDVTRIYFKWLSPRFNT